MHVCMDFRRFYNRLQGLTSFKRKEKKRTLVISAPFDFKKEGGMPPGMFEDEILLMREKAAASRIGIADDLTASVNSRYPLLPNRSGSLIMRSPGSPVSTMAFDFHGAPSSPIPT